MAKKQKDEIYYLPYHEDVISALKKAAFETNSFLGYVFKYGGENSIQSG